jgi:hypothetical protein
VDESTTSLNPPAMRRLERRLRVLEAGLSVAVALLLIVGLAAMRSESQQRGGVMRVRGLIVEDAQGRPRILLGAPISNAGRKRQDEAIGMLVLGENGADHVTIGSPAPPPQIQGRVGRRDAKLAGMIIHDLDGNERGGFGYLDNDRVVLGLDYGGRTREAVVLHVMENGTAGISLTPRDGLRGPRGTLTIDNNTGTIRLRLADTMSAERLVISLRGDSTPRFEVKDAGTKRVLDLIPKLER